MMTCFYAIYSLEIDRLARKYKQRAEGRASSLADSIPAQRMQPSWGSAADNSLSSGSLPSVLKRKFGSGSPGFGHKKLRDDSVIGN